MQLVIFDVDGTLLDSQHHILAAQRTAFAALGLASPTRDESLSIVGLSLHEAFEVLVGADGPIEALCEAYKQAWTAIRTAPGFHDVLYRGARELVDDLARRPDTLLGIATGKSRAGLARVLAGQGWSNVFATVQTADTHPSKPHPSMVRAALAETGVDARDAVMIGDTTFDIEMARAAGVRPIGVAWGYHPGAALIEAGATAVADTFDALRDLIARRASAAA